jgi:hypothetical protein
MWTSLVNLRPTISRPVCSGVRHRSGTCDQFFFLLEISFRQFRSLRSNVLLVTVERNEQAVAKQRTCAEYHSYGRFPTHHGTQGLPNAVVYNYETAQRHIPDNDNFQGIVHNLVNLFHLWCIRAFVISICFDYSVDAILALRMLCCVF